NNIPGGHRASFALLTPETKRACYGILCYSFSRDNLGDRRSPASIGNSAADPMNGAVERIPTANQHIIDIIDKSFWCEVFYVMIHVVIFRSAEACVQRVAACKRPTASHGVRRAALSRARMPARSRWSRRL